MEVGDEISKQKKSMIIFSVILVAILVLSTYLLSFIKEYSYIGIRAKEQDNMWVVKRVFANGIANELGITEGMEIVDINGKPPRNISCNKRDILVINT